MDISASSVIKGLFYPLRLLITPFVYPPAFSFKKHPIHYDGTHTVKSGPSQPLYIILPPRQQHNFNVYRNLQNARIEILPPTCYSDPLKPYSNARDAQKLINRAKTYQQSAGSNPETLYILAQSLGSLTAIKALTQYSFPNTKIALITPPDSISKLLYNQPVFEIVLLMLHLLTTALILIGCGHGGLNSLAITGYILTASALCIIIISLIYHYHYNHHTYAKWVYVYKRIPDLRNLINNAVDFITSNNWNSAKPCTSIILLIPKAITLAALIILGVLYAACYTPIKITHLLGHGLVYGYLWLMGLHEDYQHLAKNINHSNTQVFHASSDTLLSTNKLYGTFKSRELENCDHGSIDLQVVAEQLASSELIAAGGI